MKHLLLNRRLVVSLLALGSLGTAHAQLRMDAESVTLEVARKELESGQSRVIDIREPQEHATGVASGVQLLPMRSAPITVPTVWGKKSPPPISTLGDTSIPNIRTFSIANSFANRPSPCLSDHSARRSRTTGKTLGLKQAIESCNALNGTWVPRKAQKRSISARSLLMALLCGKRRKP